MARAGTSAISTSRMSCWVPSGEVKWGEDATLSFRFSSMGYFASFFFAASARTLGLARRKLWTSGMRAGQM